MSRLDDYISNLYFIADNLRVLKEIQESGDCNNCKRKNCEYKVKPGQLVRYNCPFYTKEISINDMMIDIPKDKLYGKISKEEALDLVKNNKGYMPMAFEMAKALVERVDDSDVMDFLEECKEILNEKKDNIVTEFGYCSVFITKMPKPYDYIKQETIDKFKHIFEYLFTGISNYPQTVYHELYTDGDINPNFQYSTLHFTMKKDYYDFIENVLKKLRYDIYPFEFVVIQYDSNYKFIKAYLYTRTLLKVNGLHINHDKPLNSSTVYDEIYDVDVDIQSDVYSNKSIDKKVSKLFESYTKTSVNLIMEDNNEKEDNNNSNN